MLPEKAKTGFFSSKEDPMPKSLRKGKTVFILAMIALAMFNFILFYVVVNINSILLALKEFVGYSETGDVIYKFSLGNFVRLWNDITDPEVSVIGPALINTLIFFVMQTFILLPLCFFISYFLYKKVFGYKVFRFVFFLPNIISSVVLVAMFQNLIAVNGPIAAIMRHFGGKMPSLLTDERTAKWVILAYCMWTGFGVNVVLYQGAMSRIPESTIEAGKLDGVGMWREMVSIIIPMMWPTLSTTIILAMTGIFTASGPMLLFTQGKFDTMTISYWIFDQVNFSNSYEYPSAIGLTFTLLGLPIVLGCRRLMNRVYEDVEY